MAAATINVNLTLIDTADTNTTGWDKVGAGGQPSADEDVYIQDSNPGTAEQKSVVTTIGQNATVGLTYDGTGADASNTWDARDHLYVWANYTAPAKLVTTANGGQRVFFGNDNGNFSSIYVGGSEAEYLAGGWRCLVGSPSGTIEEGNATTPYNAYGAGGRGAENVGKDNFAIDVLRYGRGLQLVDGDSTNPGTMKSFTDVNDNISNQYGVVRAQGSGASVQGEVSIGHVDATASSTYFEDSNYAFFVPNKNPLSGSSSFATLDTFTGVRVLGSGTTALFNNFAFSTADEYDKGYFSTVADYPFTYASGSSAIKVDLDGCSFTDWGQTRMASNTTISNTTWISCEAITINGGSIDQCTVETGIGGTYLFAAGTPDNISNTSFIGGGVGGGHGFEVTSEGTYNFVGNGFTGFGASDTNDAAVHINGGATGIAVTFNITGGGTGGPDQGFTYRLTGTGSTVRFVSAVTVNINGLPVVPTGNGTEIRILQAGSDPPTEIAGVGTENHRTSTYSFSLTSGTNFDVRILNVDYVPFFLGGLTASNDPTNIPVDLKIDRVYKDDTPPSGE